MKVNPKGTVPTLLLEMALEGLPTHVAALVESGESLGEYVWAYFDGRVRPGRTFAVMHLQNGGASLEQATRQVDAGIKNTRASGGIFAFGVMTTARGRHARVGDSGAGLRVVALLRAHVLRRIRGELLRAARIAEKIRAPVVLALRLRGRGVHGHPADGILRDFAIEVRCVVLVMGLCGHRLPLVRFILLTLRHRNHYAKSASPLTASWSSLYQRAEGERT